MAVKNSVQNGSKTSLFAVLASFAIRHVLWKFTNQTEWMIFNIYWLNVFYTTGILPYLFIIAQVCIIGILLELYFKNIFHLIAFMLWHVCTMK